MMRRSIVAGAAVAAAFAAVSANAASIGDFAGHWLGVSVEVEGNVAGESIQPSDLSAHIEETGDGFSLSLKTPDGSTIDATFAPTSVPGVFEVSSGGGLFSMFSSPTGGNPLEGEMLVWARIEDNSLIAYGLEVSDDGAFVMHHQVRTVSGSEMQVEEVEISPGPEILTIRGVAERSED